GILPAIAIDQSRPVRTSRSSVGTMTELHDYLKLLYAKLGVPHCRMCGKAVRRDSAESAAEELLAAHPGTRALVTFDVVIPPSLPWEDAQAGLLAAGFIRALDAAGATVDLEGAPRPRSGERVTIVQDRIVLRASERGRLVDSLEQALRHGRGRVTIRLPDTDGAAHYSTALECAACGFTVR